MSVAFQERLRQEKESTGRNRSQIPCPSSLLVAASALEYIMGAADVERSQREYGVAEGGHERGGGIGCRLTTGGAAFCGQEEEKQQCRDGCIRFHGEQQRSHQHSLQVPHKRAIPSQGELALQRVPSRRLGRPYRKRLRHVSCREFYYVNASGEAHLQRPATAGPGKAAAITGRPRDISISGTAAQMQQEEHGTASAGNCAPAPRGVAFSKATPVFISSASHNQFRVPISDPSCPPARSTTRILSSETYLRRLFVTASLAHVLSLDACLPRSFPMMRKVSSRAAVRIRRCGEEAEEEEEEKESEEAGISAGQVIGLTGNAGGGKRWKGHDEAGGGDIGGGIRGNGSADDKEIAAASLLAAAEQNSSGSFKLVFPVTLIDAAGQLWSMTYVSTTRDNLHSGRLVEGWDTFCCANKLRIGDEVEFSRVEAHEQGGGRLCKEAVAMVVVRKRNCRNK